MHSASEQIPSAPGSELASESGSREEYEAFFRCVFPRAVGVALRISGDRSAAEDAALEALAKAHTRWRKIGGEPWREPWVLRVTVNEAIRRLPRRPPLVPHPLDQTDPTDVVVVRQTLVAALRLLPKRQREAVVLRYLVGLSEPEVAVALGLSLGTVKTHLRRGLARLRTTLGPSLKEEHLANLV